MRNNQQTDSGGFQSVARFATTCGVTRATVLRWVRTGAVPAVRIGRKTLIPKDALSRLIRKEVPNAS